jgi:guanosine-3',5'-bis(diphosphate) 3'-pyrophosphohydrolase
MVIGREKNLYSIYNKMVKKELRFYEVMDIYAFRVIVDDIDTCYRVLGQMHSLYKPRPGRFKDYIAIPKTNGYQSLHTSLVGPHGVPVEIQIRTEYMEQMADKGVAAHWVYKTNGDATSSTAQIRAQRWMKNLLELQQSAGSSFEFIESVKTDLFPDEIYVFTPEGRILELPTNATPVDFAYAVHTDIGNSCVGARVERQPFPLSRPLTSGQTVEIITAPGARPNAAWLNFVVTSRARTKIRQFLKNLRAEESIILGRRLLSHSLGGKKIEDMPAENLRQVLHDTRHDSLEGLLADIGLGNQMSVVIARRLLGQHEQEPEKEKKSSSTHRKLPIRGSGGMLVTFANCCRPIPGDAIIAHISPGKGLVVHQESCPNLRGYNREPDKYQPVQWDMEQLGEQEFRTSIVVEVVNHQGVLAQLANVIAATGANIHSISTEEKDARVYQVNLLITTKHRVHLANIMRKIRVMPDVLRVNRTTNKIRSKESS